MTDENVARAHLATLERALAAKGIRSTAIIMPPGEATKAFAVPGTRAVLMIMCWCFALPRPRSLHVFWRLRANCSAPGPRL